jgi:antitoxin component YwqK of YwqJK toxin-antitoxin module
MKPILLASLLLLGSLSAWAETVKTFYPDGSKRSETTYKDGRKNGVEHIFYPDGATLKYSRNYVYGKLHGLQQKYDKNALLIEEENYTHGKLDGRSRYYHNGLLVSEIDYRLGLPDGEYKEYYPSGVMRLKIIWLRGKAIEGYRYSEDGKRTPVDAKSLQQLTDKAQAQLYK